MWLTDLIWPYRINIAGKTDISSVEVSTRLPSHGVLLYCERWGVLGGTPRQIHIAKKVALGPQQLQNQSVVDLFIQRTQLFSLSSALALSPHPLSERQRTDVLVCLCHLVSSFKLKQWPDTIFFFFFFFKCSMIWM